MSSLVSPAFVGKLTFGFPLLWKVKHWLTKKRVWNEAKQWSSAAWSNNRQPPAQPQKHLPKMLIPHGGRVRISLSHFKRVPCPQPGYPHKDEKSWNFHKLAGVCCGMMESALLQVICVAGIPPQPSAGVGAEWSQEVFQGNRGNLTSGTCFCVQSNLTKSWPLAERI